MRRFLILSILAVLATSGVCFARGTVHHTTSARHKTMAVSGTHHSAKHHVAKKHRRHGHKHTTHAQAQHQTKTARIV